MAIVSSTLVLDQHTQRDGSRGVRETHVDHLGREYIVSYLAASGVDTNAVLAARAISLWDSLVAGEALEIIAGVHIRFEYITKAALAPIFRERYRAASGVECARMATWLLNRIDDGTFTDTQVRNAFGLDVTQYANMKARFTTLRDHYNGALAAQGE